MLDNISDPGNFGAILRTADWFGIHHVICSPETVDVFNPKTVQASMGSIARVHVYYHDLKSALISLSPNIPVYGALLKGKELKNISFSKNGILLIGNEAHGISANIIECISHPVFIPSFLKGLPGYQQPESLNAAVATAILCYEVRRS
jgi:TrmH family RNA methyltransferase